MITFVILIGGALSIFAMTMDATQASLAVAITGFMTTILGILADEIVGAIKAK